MEEFESLWAEGNVPGWTKRSEQAGGEAAQRAFRPVDMSKFHTAESLEALGLERLKEGLQVGKERRCA
jgi:hypothetical protein